MASMGRQTTPNVIEYVVETTHKLVVAHGDHRSIKHLQVYSFYIFIRHIDTQNSAKSFSINIVVEFTKKVFYKALYIHSLLYILLMMQTHLLLMVSQKFLLQCSKGRWERTSSSFLGVIPVCGWHSKDPLYWFDCWGTSPAAILLKAKNTWKRFFEYVSSKIWLLFTIEAGMNP